MVDISYNDGRVGIGTDSPITYLQVDKPHVNQYGQVVISAPAGEDVQLSLMEGEDVKAYFWWDSDQKDFRIQNNTSGTWVSIPMVETLGIGNSDPSEKLDVSGNLNVDGDIIIDGRTSRSLG